MNVGAGPLLVVSTGDPEGIGPEVSARAARAWLERTRAGRVVLVAAEGRCAQNALPNLIPLESVLRGQAGAALATVPAEPGVRPGAGPTAAGGREALRVLTTAEQLVRAASDRALVTAPVSKEAISRAGESFVGHTDWLAARVGVAEPLMLFAAGSLRVALATVHVPLAAVPLALSADRLVRQMRLLADGLATRFAIPAPRIAVLGLNPHAGEGGLLGSEEESLIAPAIAAALAAGLRVSGPHSADTFFRPQALAHCDAVLAMYHDQGLIPVKCLAFGESVNITLGLPYVRTSVDHGTAFDLVRAGGTPDAGSMLAALQQAADLLAAQPVDERNRAI